MSEQGYDHYLVVINDEEQYSIWPAHRPLPLGWASVEAAASSQEECLAYVDKVWTDMRPRSLRIAMDADESGQS
jgi:MbtH protein